MNSLDAALLPELDTLRQQGLARALLRVDSPQGPHITIDGQSLLSFASNDYLGLAQHPALIAAAIDAATRFGTGAGASRLLGGSLPPHDELETALASFKRTEAALTFGSGYATALGTLGALLGPHDIVLLDKRAHACLVDAARLCGATLRVFKHNRLDSLDRLLQWADTRRQRPHGAPRSPRVLVVTESVFSMDGDVAPLRDLVALKERHDAWLLLDEAHATGLYGPRRAGLADALQLADRVDIHMGTLGKALGAAGGFICGSRALVAMLVHRARSFIFSTAPAPPAAAAAAAGIRLLQSPEGQSRCARLWDNIGQVRHRLTALGWPLPDSPGAIVPLVVGAEDDATALAASLRQHGVFVPAVRYPAVARGAARLRLTVSAAHKPEDLARLEAALAQVPPPPRPPASHA
ncbi:MAG: 8-amino-7-oxononanoate synthase [Verrucomicrobia bacterium]|nr:8-amino-7-oxononanoate synthase [Verrucomicrobiota bacterium]